ncbi:hypothetical protein DH2020_049388 [Rehmannia glutinosa]|uniref:Uncharacterized protein n=1 Tax=Rehmannia glutinosa TaxID=99300 RepID=A0ABR0U2X2_REHGL
MEEPHLSGAYIRSLVKQLTTNSKPKDDTTSSHSENSDHGEKNCDEQGKKHKKQVRRRIQTRKPYQERLLNMAEARREIVSALKLHRAAMKQASEKSSQGPKFGHLGPKQRHNIIAYSPGLYSPYSWPVSSIAPPLFVQENLDFALPSQTLGLNLNLQDFNNHFHSSTNLSSSIYSSSSPSTSSSSAPSAAAEEIPYMGGAPPAPAAAEIGSIGDRDLEIEDFVNSPFDEVMELPAWMNANESCLQLVDGFCSDEYFQNPALPW